MSKQVNVIATMTLKEGTLEEVKQVLAELVNETRKELGNIEYSIMEDVTKPNTVFSIEKWESAEAEAKHWEMPHLTTAFAKIESHLAAEPSVNKGSAIN